LALTLVYQNTVQGYRRTTLRYFDVVSDNNFSQTVFHLLLPCWIKATQQERYITFFVTLNRTATGTFNLLPEMCGENDKAD